MSSTRGAGAASSSSLSPYARPSLAKRRRTSSLRGEPPGDSPAALSTMTDRMAGAHAAHPRDSFSQRPHRGRKRRKVKSLFRRTKSMLLRHTWLGPLIATAAILALYALNPTDSNPVHNLIFLSYPLPPDPAAGPDAPTQYGKGRLDLAFVGFYIIVLSFTREFAMQRILRPLSIRAGMRTRNKQYRFMEQGYTAMYFSVFGPLGLYVMKQTPLWYFNTDAMFQGFPHITHVAIFKAYYLLQAAYWAQQFIVLLLMLEKPRKDFKELVAHHIITVALICLSYCFHFTHMGLPVYITHDVSDFFLATSKLLNYMDSPLVVPYFLVFLFAWAYLRHYQNLRILLSLMPLPLPFPEPINNFIYLYTSRLGSLLSTLSSPLIPTLKPLTSTFATLFPETSSLLSRAPAALTSFFARDSDFARIGPYSLSWESEQYKCWISQWCTFILILSLQLINMFWFFLILRILWRLVASWGAIREDERSEYSDEEEEAERKRELEQLRTEQEKKVEEVKEKVADRAGVEVAEKKDGDVKVLVNGEPVRELQG